MEKPDSNSGADGSTVYNTVFIDTSLDTHLAMIVSDSDTVSDLKKKMMHEHPLCFPNIGDIKINALKVKRKGYLYHLSDSMFVKSAFDGVSKSWFLSVDASGADECNQNHNSRKPDTGNAITCLGITTNNSSADVVDLLPDGPLKRLPNIKDSSLPQDENNHLAEQTSAPQPLGFGNSAEANSEDLPMGVDQTADGNSKVLFPVTNNGSRPKVQDKDVANKEISDDLPASVAASVLKEKHKTKKRKKDIIHDHAVKENGASVAESGKDAMELDNVNKISVVVNEMKLGNQIPVDETSRSVSSSDRNKTPATRKRIAEKETEVTGEHLESETNNNKDVCLSEQENNLAEKSSQPRLASKQKAEKKDGTLPDITTSEYSSGQKLGSTSANFEHNAKSVKDSQRKKRIKQKPNPSEVGSGITLAKDVDVDTVQAVEAIIHKDLGSKADPGFFLGANTESGLLSSKEMLEVSKRNRSPHSEGDEDMVDANDGNTERKNEAPETGVASVIKRRDSMELKASHVASHPIAVSQEEISHQNDIGVSGDGNQSTTLEDILVKPKKSNKKTKKSKKTKDPAIDIVPLERPNSLIGDHLSDNAEKDGTADGKEAPKRDTSEYLSSVTDMGADDVIRVVLDSLQQGNNGPENAENLDKKSSRKKRKKKSSTIVDLPELQEKDDVDHQDPTIPAAAIDIVPLEGPNSLIGDLLSDTAEKDGTADGKETSRRDTSEYLPSVTDMGADEVTGDVLESLQQGNNGPANAENLDKKSSRKKRKKKSSTIVDLPELQGKDDVDHQDPTILAAAIDIVPLERPNSLIGDHLSDNAEKDGTADEKEASKRDASEYLPSDTDMGADDVIGEVLESLQQGNNGPVKAENLDKKSSRKKSKKKSSTIVDLPELQGKDDVDHQDPTIPAAAEDFSEASVLSKSTRKTKVVKSSSAAQSNGSNLVYNKNTGDSISLVQTQLESSQNTLTANHEGRPMQDVTNGDDPKNTHLVDDNNSVKVPCESERLRSQDQHEIVASGEILVDKVTDKKGVETEVIGKRKRKPDVHPGGSAPDLPTSQLSNGKQHKKAKPQAAKTSSIQSQRSSSVVEPYSSKVQSIKTLDHDGRPIQDVVNEDQPKSTHVGDAIKSIEVHSESEKIKSHQQTEVDSGEKLVDEVTDQNGVEAEVKGKKKKKKKKPDVHSGGSIPDLPSSQMLNGNLLKKEKPQAAISSSIQSHRSSSKVEPHRSNVQSSKPPLTNSGSAVKKSLQSHNADKINSIPKVAQRPIDINSSKVHTGLEENNAPAASTSTLERSKNTINLNKGSNGRQSHLGIEKGTGSNNGKVMNSLENKKSLLAVAGSIFKHDDKESSDDEDGVDNSDNSTRTPSSFNDDSDADVSSSRNEREGDRRNGNQPGSSSPNDMPFKDFIRTTSTYKRALLRASQSELDSQHDEIVPDSQANL
ncbi:hypothetical protein COLO4_23547 [Corchorus olitorius]|uniref:Uncharacterized protein n=1 Tax=Corchorus olitorius TaxID=93759 RepID=A0A1R3IFZ4_9ROSI|nr:hypothetical protein COLO4_23547 [Corchorus olitorius]